MRFVSTGENCGKPCPVCKKCMSVHQTEKQDLEVTIMILSIWIDKSGQTVETLISLLLKEQSDY